MMINVVSKLAGWRGYAAAAIAGLVLAGVAAWTIQGWRYGAEIANLKAEHARTMDTQAQAAIVAVEAARIEERRRTAAVEKARDEALEKARVAAADAVGVRTELGRLRGHANALVNAAVARNPALADGSPTGTGAIDLLAYMLGRVSDRAAALAELADRARIAGLTCERSYDELRAGSGSK